MYTLMYGYQMDVMISECADPGFALAFLKRDCEICKYLIVLIIMKVE